LIVLVFGVLLAVAPFLYMRESNPFAQGVTTYDNICLAARAKNSAAVTNLLSATARTLPPNEVLRLAGTLVCFDRAKAQLTWEALPQDPPGQGASHQLIVESTDPTVPGKDVVRFIRQGDAMVWAPEPLP